MVAVSPDAQINSDPKGINMGNVRGDNGNAWGGAAVKGSIWDDE